MTRSENPVAEGSVLEESRGERPSQADPPGGEAVAQNVLDNDGLHLVTTHFVLSGPEDEKLSWLVASYSLLLAQIVVATSVFMGFAIPSCSSNEQCRSDQYC